MPHPSRLATCALLSVLWLGCSAQSLSGEDSMDSAPTAGSAKGGSGGGVGTGGTNQGGSGGATAGAAGTSSGGKSGGNGALKDDLSASCQACMRALCPGLCPAAGACDPCDDPAGSCSDPGSPTALKVHACACDTGAACQYACVGDTDFCTFAAPSSEAGGAAGASSGGSAGSSNSQGGTGDIAGNGGAGDGQGALAGGGGSGSPGVPCESLNEDTIGCADGVDNDCDGQIDCDDVQCAGACKSACVAPTPIVAGVTLHASLKGRQNSFDPACAALPSTGPDAAYLFTAPEDGILQVALSSQDTDMILSLRQQCGGGGADILCQDAVSVGVEELSRLVKAGDSFYLVVGAAQPGQEGDYSLAVTMLVPTCGDGQIQPGEECDDGDLNGTDKHDCSAQCLLLSCMNSPGLTDVSAPGYEFVPTNGDTSQGESHLSPSCGLLGSNAPEMVYSFRPSRTGRVEIELDPGPDVDLTLSVRSACGASGAERACVDGARKGGIERLSLLATAGETLFLVVDGYDSDQKGPFTLKARSVPAVCGDGIASLAEQCDSKTPGVCTDHCTSALQSGSLIPESSLGPDDAMPLAGEAQSEIFPAGDADTYAVTLAADQTALSATVAAPGQEGCGAMHLDSQIEILDAQGLLVGFNDDSAVAGGFCSQALAQGLTPGATYRVRVRSSQTFAPAQVFSYKLLVAAP